MHHYIDNIPQQYNNFKRNDHEFTQSRPYIPDNTLLMHAIGSDSFFTAIEAALPPIFSRKKASEVLGGMISPKTLSNLDALHQGAPKVCMGNKVDYERESFMLWLRGRLRGATRLS